MLASKCVDFLRIDDEFCLVAQASRAELLRQISGISSYPGLTIGHLWNAPTTRYYPKIRSRACGGCCSDSPEKFTISEFSRKPLTRKG